MSEYDISIIIQGDDRASGPLQSIAGQLHGVGEAADSASSQGGGFFSNLLSTAGGFLAANVLGSIAGQVKDFVAGGIADARETAQLMGATETIIKNTGGAAGMSATQVTDLASALSDAAGMSLFGDDKIQGAENVLLKYKELKGIIPGVTQLSVDMAQSLGKDPAAAAEVLGRALQKPEDAAGKLAKMGIVLDDAQKAMIKTMVAAGDTAGAQTYLMGQLNSSFGGSAAAAAKADGGMAQLKGRLGEAGETIGTALLPVLGILGKLLLDNVIPMVEKAATWLGENLPSAIETVKTFVTETLIPAFQRVWAYFQANILPTLIEVATWLKDHIPPAIAATATFVTETLIPAFQRVWAYFQANILPTLIEVATWLKDHIPPAIAATATFVTETLIPAFQRVWAFIDANILPILRALANVVIAGLKAEVRLLAELWTGTLQPALEKVWGFIDAKIMPIFRTLAAMVSDVMGPAMDGLGKTISPIAGWFDNIGTSVGGVVKWLNDLASGIDTVHMPAWLQGGGGITIPGFADGVTNFGGGLAMVGERGPELLRLPGGSDVMPGPFSVSAPRGGGGGGGSSTSISVGQIVVQGNGDPAATARAVREELLKLQRRNLSLGFT